jgi:hypothetical protein
MNAKPPGFRDQYRAAPKLVQVLIPVVVILVVIWIASSGSGSSSSTATTSASSTPSAHVSTNPRRPNEATGSYTPSVGPTHPVTVDGLVYKIEAAHTAAAIKDSVGDVLPATNGLFIVLRVRIHSDKADSAAFNDNVRLTAAGQTYDPDGDFNSVVDNDVGSHATVSGNLIFDVPRGTLTHRPQLKLTELGFGDTKGYIALPQLKPPKASPAPSPQTTPTSTPAPSTIPAPAPTPAPSPPSESPGSYSHADDVGFCSTHQCIGSFETEPGYIVQCTDGTYSHSGGISGSCSRHGGNA